MDLLDQLVRSSPADLALRRIAQGLVASHAFLVDSDDAGVVRYFAMHLARALACRAASDRPCGSCGPCGRPGAPYVNEVIPMGVEYRIQQVHDLVAECSLSLEPGARRVYVFSSVEAMNDESANAFLKVLEEPPQAVVFVLATASPGQLLATIRSRCHPIHVDFPPALELASGPLASGRIPAAWSWAVLETWGRSPALLGQIAGEAGEQAALEIDASPSRESLDAARENLEPGQLANPPAGLFVDLPHALLATSWFFARIGRFLEKASPVAAIELSQAIIDWTGEVGEAAGDGLHAVEAAIRKSSGPAYVHPLLEDETFERSYRKRIVFLALDAFFRAALLVGRAARPDRPPPEGEFLASLAREIPAFRLAASLGHSMTSQLSAAVDNARAQLHANVNARYAVEGLFLSLCRFDTVVNRAAARPQARGD